MRSAPSMSSSKVMSLSEGAGITLIARAGAMDGYDWFKISFRGSTVISGAASCARRRRSAEYFSNASLDRRLFMTSASAIPAKDGRWRAGECLCVRCSCSRGFLIAFAAVVTAPAFAETRGSPVRIIFPFGSGSSADALARIVADELSAGLNRPVIVEARPGAGGRIGVRAVKSAEPDGATLLLTPIAPMAVYQSIYPSLEYDPVKDFAPDRAACHL